MNIELRQSLQRAEDKLLECAAVPASKRKDLVNSFLLQKDEELAEARRENEFLHNEVDQKLRNVELLQTKRQIVEHKEAEVAPAPARGGVRGRGGAYAASLRRKLLPQVGGGGAAAAAAAGAAAGRRPAAQGNGRSVRARGFGMSKELALDIILFEVKRLKSSLAAMQKHKGELNEKV